VQEGLPLQRIADFQEKGLGLGITGREEVAVLDPKKAQWLFR